VTVAAQDPYLRGEDRIREVFARVSSGDEGVADLWASDGVVIAGETRIEGRDAIRDFYRTTIDALHPRPEVQRVFGSPGSNQYVAIVEVPTDRGHIHALDLFTLDDEGIRQLEIFNRSIE
jgi:hypothetical protein